MIARCFLRENRRFLVSVKTIQIDEDEERLGRGVRTRGVEEGVNVRGVREHETG